MTTEAFWTVLPKVGVGSRTFNFLIGDDNAAISSYEKAVAGYTELLVQSPDSIDNLIHLVSTRSEMSNAIRRSSYFVDRYGKPASMIMENLEVIEQHLHHDDPRVQFVMAESLAAMASAEVHTYRC